MWQAVHTRVPLSEILLPSCGGEWPGVEDGQEDSPFRERMSMLSFVFVRLSEKDNFSRKGYCFRSRKRKLILNSLWHFSKKLWQFIFLIGVYLLGCKREQSVAQFRVLTHWSFRWTHWTPSVRLLCTELPSQATCRPAASCWVTAPIPPSSPYKALRQHRWGTKPCSRFWAVSPSR